MKSVCREKSSITGKNVAIKPSNHLCKAQMQCWGGLCNEFGALNGVLMGSVVALSILLMPGAVLAQQARNSTLKESAASEIEDSANITPSIPVGATESNTLKEVVVTAAPLSDAELAQTEYAARNAAVVGKIPMTLREIPQSVSVMTRQRIADQNFSDLADTLSWMPGVVNWRTYQPESPALSARGFSLSNFAIDGSMAGTSFWQLPADLAMYDQVEIVRGPAGLFYGRGNNGSGAGTVNLVRKRPQREAHLTAEVAAGSWNQYRGTVDMGRSLTQDGRLRGRLIASHLDRDYFYDHAARENSILYGVLEYDLTPQTLLTWGAEYSRRRAVPFVAALSVRGDGTIPDWPRSTTTAVPWGRSYGDTYGTFLELQHRVNADWRLKASYNYQREDLFWDWAWVTGWRDPYPGSTQDPFYMTAQRRDTDDRAQSFDLNATGQFNWLGRDHDVVVGMDWSRRKQVSAQPGRGGYSYNYGDGSWVDPDLGNLSDFPWRPSTMSGNPSHYDYKDSSFYANLRLRLLEKLTLTTGARLSNYYYGGLTNNTVRGQSGYDKSDILTPYLALSYDLTGKTTVHVSYADVYNVSNSYTVSGDMVDPVIGANLELGIKSELFGGDLQTSFALYQLDRKNQTRVDPDAPYPCSASPSGGYCYLADNEQRVRGVDAEIIGRISPSWQLSASANWLQKRYTRWLDRTGNVSATQGTSWDQSQPERMLKLWSTHRLPGAASNWRVAAGFRAQSDTFSSRSASGVIPAYTVRQGGYSVWDAMVAWDINPKWTARLNVSNLFDKHYYSSISTGSVMYGEPRAYMFTLTGKF